MFSPSKPAKRPQTRKQDITQTRQFVYEMHNHHISRIKQFHTDTQRIYELEFAEV